MNLCKNGHDKDTVGISSTRQCLVCKHDAQRSRRRKKPGCDHHGACVWITSAAGSRYCQIRASKNRRGASVRKIVTDGFEDEFGPVPAPVHNKAWFDRVAVERYLRGHDPGRPLTMGEHRGVHLLERIREGHGVREEAPELVSA